MARNGPRDDFHNQPTQNAKYGMGGQPPPGEPPPNPADWSGQPSYDYLGHEPEPKPWYRRPVMLIGWVVLVLILIGLIIYGIIELLHGNQGISPTPSTSTSTSTTTTTTATTTPPTTTTTTSTSRAVQPPPPQTHQQTQQQPTHRHHLPHLPSVITIPEVPTVITLPPGLP